MAKNAAIQAHSKGATFLLRLLPPGTRKAKGRAIDVSVELGHPCPEHTAGANPDHRD